MTDPEPESLAERVGDSLLSYSLFNPAATSSLKYSTDDVCDANERKLHFFALHSACIKSFVLNKHRLEHRLEYILYYRLFRFGFLCASVIRSHI